MNPAKKNTNSCTWRQKLFEIIFEADTPAGKWFDIVLIISILLSVVIVMLDSVSSVRGKYGQLLYAFEWFFTILFTLEYVLRLLCVGRPVKYAVSFFGIIDLSAILPTYMSLFFFGSRYLSVVRVLRVLRSLRAEKSFVCRSKKNIRIYFRGPDPGCNHRRIDVCNRRAG